MKNSKIDWCDHTWNPVTGCMNDCEYCYARGIAHRFSKSNLKDKEEMERMWQDLYGEPFNKIGPNLYELDGKHIVKGQVDPYPYKFKPTLHCYRLDFLKKIKNSANIFVCSMADLFGEWIPRSWIKEVFEACEEAPQHNYLFLTKNPNGIPQTSHMYSETFSKHRDNFWFGITVNTQTDLEQKIVELTLKDGNRFLSIEPIFEEINLTKIDVAHAIIDVLNGKEYHMFGGGEFRKIHWVIVGSETGNRKGKVIPKRKWIENIVEQCRTAGIPIFMKESLRSLMGDDFIQEFPEELRRNGEKQDI